MHGLSHARTPPDYFQSLHRYTLAVFALLTTNQTIFWFSFSSAPVPVNSYFGTDDADLDLLLNWGPIIFLPVCPFVAWLLRRSGGLNIAMRTGAFMCFIACAVRAIPFLLSPSLRKSRWGGQLLLHLGQIINAAVGAHCHVVSFSALRAVVFSRATCNRDQHCIFRGKFG